jgi:hypothetical protein
MKRLLFLAVCLIFIAACGPGSGFQVSSINPQTDISKQPSNASYEMYSWYNGQNWAYAFFEQATRVYSFNDITSSNEIIIGDDAALDALLTLPRGSKVYWNLQRIKGFVLPEREVVEKFRLAAKRRYIHLEVINWPS